MKLLVINGPSLNMLGIREPEIYGNRSYHDLESYIRDVCRRYSVSVDVFQSSHEGAIVDKIHQARGIFDAIVINPAAYTHTSVAILDALNAVGLPAVEVHLTDVNKREEFRRVSYVRAACQATFAGYGFESYKRAIEFLLMR